jgi:hypothetical protein
MRRFGSFIALAVMALTMAVIIRAQFANEVATPLALTQPEGTRSIDDLLDTAYRLGQDFGLSRIDSQEYVWITSGDWMGSIITGGGRQDPTKPLLIVAMRGEGFWNGPAGTIKDPIRMEGLTVALDGLEGGLVSSVGGYFIPDGTSGVKYRQILDHPTLAPVVEGLLRQTEAAPQPLPATLP